MKRLVVLLSAIILTVNLFAQKTETPDKDKVIKVRGITITCKAGEPIEYYQSGKVKSCVPKYAFSFVNPKNYRYSVAADKPVKFDENGNIIGFTLGRNAVVETGGGDHYSALGGTEIAFYADGSVKSFVPKFPVEVKTATGRKFMAKARESVEFYPGGWVKSFVTANTITVLDKDGKRKTFEAGQRVSLTRNGRAE